MRAAQAIGRISEIIGRVNDISATIATAVEEQSATTSEMSRNVSEAAKGSGEVAKNITGVATAAQSRLEPRNQIRLHSRWQKCLRSCASWLASSRSTRTAMGNGLSREPCLPPSDEKDCSIGDDLDEMLNQT